MQLRRRKKADFGEAISMEDAISMLTVIFVLFLVLFIPMVKIDQANLIKAKVDPFWVKIEKRISNTPHNVKGVQPYLSMFSLEGTHTIVTHDHSSNTIYIEGISEDKTITVIKHNTVDDSYISLSVQDHGGSTLYKIGSMVWSSDDKEWFAADTPRIDYGSDPISSSMLSSYKAWIQRQEK